MLWSPGPSHRRLTQKGLEFGSPIFFQYSWLSPIGLRARNIHVKAEMAFSEVKETACWIGIALRSQGYLANDGHLVYLSSPEGLVMRSGPQKTIYGELDQHKIGELIPFDNIPGVFYPFDIFMDDKVWSIKVGTIKTEISVADFHAFTTGRVLFQAFRCRAFIKNVEIEEL